MKALEDGNRAEAHALADEAVRTFPDSKEALFSRAAPRRGGTLARAGAPPPEGGGARPDVEPGR